jgi:curved DNA-binding protein CbpA
MATVPSSPVESLYGGMVVRVTSQGHRTVCQLGRGAPILVSSVLGHYLGAGDEIAAPLSGGQEAGTEVYVRKGESARPLRDVYQAPIGYVTQPKEDKRKELFMMAEVRGRRLEITAISIPCSAVRDHFYVADRRRDWAKQRSLYDIVGMPPTGGPAELRLSFKIRQMELQASGDAVNARHELERAYNVLARPELRACYDALLRDPEAPALFPYAGFGSLIVSGDRSRDGKTFFANRILAFLPELKRRRFGARLRKFEFYRNHAMYRDARRKLELTVDQAAMPLIWDQTWNQWKHLLSTKVEIDATFVHTGKFRTKAGAWELVEWESALPSRLQVNLAANIQEQIEAAKKTFHRFGQYSRAIEQLRLRIEREPIEKRELDRMLGELGVPGDFDVAQITWQPDYDPFFYRQLAKRACRLFLFRDEYLFETPAGVAVETPQLGHATYLFASPASIEAFLALYTKVRKEDIRHNRDNVATRLGFLGRIVHGANPKTWMTELRAKLGEPAEYADVIE